MTDYWPQEEGAIFDSGSYIIPCYPEDTITELSAVELGTTAAGRVTVKVTNAIGDGCAVALRAGDTGVPARIPVLFYGIVKLTTIATATVTAGTFCMNNTTTTYAFGASVGLDTDLTTLKVGGGASYVLGMALQGTGYSAAGDNILVLVGKCM